MKLVIGSDHAGYLLKTRLAAWLRSRAGGGHDVQDLGCASVESCDYPDYAEAVGRAVSRKQAERGLLLCGTGIGMSIAANKIKGVRAAVSWNAESAALAAEHNHANVLCLPARFVTLKKAEQMATHFLKAPFTPGRHRRRVRKMMQLERVQRNIV